MLEHSVSWRQGWLLGFSDITSLLLARLAAGFDGGVHGPLLTTIANEPDWSKERLKRLLFGKSIEDIYGKGWQEGIAIGPLVVANLTIATHLLGTHHLPDLTNAILIFEDIGEAPYRIDRMLTQWRLSGQLHKLSGIGFGNFHCEDKIDKSDGLNFTFEQILIERTNDLGIPRIGNLPVGHINGNAALPVGRLAKIDGNKGSLSINFCG